MHCISQNASQTLNKQTRLPLSPYIMHGTILLSGAVYEENYGKSTMILNMNSSTGREGIYTFFFLLPYDDVVCMVYSSIRCVYRINRASFIDEKWLYEAQKRRWKKFRCKIEGSDFFCNRINSFGSLINGAV